MTRSKIHFPLVVLEAVVASIPEQISDLEAFKAETVMRSMKEDTWQKKLPPSPEDLRDAYMAFVYELCLARQARALLPHSYADRLWAVSAAISFLQISGFPSELIKPFQDLIGDLEDLTQASQRRGKPGKPLMQFNKLTRGAWAAAAVTALSQKGNSVQQALKMVCKKSGLELKWLRNFRLNIIRGNSDQRTYQMYDLSLRRCRDYRAESILKSVY